eukprot:TRINITY_DN15217_c0_g1_i1.p1 TRINITY_DN15217_c0_g1~~TRINITY_DN15217_c0_g1_i1.p1  ORF type:complete len:230 (+),score=37.18 TRINITY_DN15217_c0_g1_i1:120-809(+)
MPSLVGSEMCIRDRYQRRVHGVQAKDLKPWCLSLQWKNKFSYQSKKLRVFSQALNKKQKHIGRNQKSRTKTKHQCLNKHKKSYLIFKNFKIRLHFKTEAKLKIKKDLQQIEVVDLDQTHFLLINNHSLPKKLKIKLRKLKQYQYVTYLKATQDQYQLEIKEEKFQNQRNFLDYLELSLFGYYPSAEKIYLKKWDELGELFLKISQNNKEAITQFQEDQTKYFKILQESC